MDTRDIRRRIKTIIAEAAGLRPDQISDDASLVGDQILNSLALIETASAIEREFQLGRHNVRWQDVRSVADVVELVASSRP